MKNIMKYKGYFGSAVFDDKEPILYGKLEFVKALITYEAPDAAGLKAAFKDAVDDYLEMCEQEGIEPEKPFKGSFNIRIRSKLHEKIALAAQRKNQSLNNYVSDILEREHLKNNT